MEEGTSSQASSRSLYEVFLSFRGSDTRHTFTDLLYQGMVQAGIIVFRDSESLHVGEKIGKLLQVIKNSKIYIPIFSTNYACSDWCLRELAHMVECTSRSDGSKVIMPLFLDVEPADVKLKTTLYEQALSKRQKICSEVESWKKALTEVGNLIGWNWKKDESQADLIKLVIETVLHKLNVGNKKIVTENLVGVDDRIEAIIKMLEVGADSVQFLIIHGMGGIGKTTLAKVIFNRLFSHFKDCNFLSDVGESSRRHGLLHLQKQLLSKFIDPRSILDQIYDVDDGINMIKRVLHNKKVLIVLDNVDEKEQLKSLAEKGDWFGSGSRIVITTRDQSVLTTQGEEATAEGPTNISAYEVCEMKFDHALKLFSTHAFRRDSPLNQYVSLSEKIVRTLGNLPLSLEVIGSFLNGKSKASWVETLKNLKKAPPKEVQRKLMISYEMLDDGQKQIFLDIACFFVTKDKTYPSYMWDACGYCPHIALEVLVFMSLIKIKDDNTFWMHDQLRDLGREIVRKENFDDPCERSRVHDPEEALSILKRKEGSRKIKALSLGEGTFRKIGEFGEFEAPFVRFREDIILKHDEFAYLEKLRFFQGYVVSFVGDFNNLLSDLKWLSCCGCSSMFENFHPINLVVLDLSRCNISEKDIDWIKAARKLKVLDLKGCYNLRRTPDLPMLVPLEILSLNACHDLESIDSIKEARTLKVLDLSWCSDLRRILDLSMLVSLEILRLRGCWKIKKLPDSIGKLQSLIELDFTRSGIHHLPDSFGNLKQLTILRMCNIEGGLTKLPRAIWLVNLLDDPFYWSSDSLYLCCLKMPDMSWTQISGLPTVASLVSNIRELEIAAQDGGRFWHPTWDALDEMENVVAFLPGNGYASTPSLVEKRMLASSTKRFLLQLPSSSRELVFRELATAYSRFSFSYWVPIILGVCDSELEKLHMQDCTFSRWLKPFKLKVERFAPPRSLWCQLLTKVLAPSHMKNLQEVDLFECELLVKIHGLDELGSLSSLKVTYCSSIERMPDLSKSRKLRELWVGKCPKLRSVEGLDRLESLKHLWIHDCRSLESLADTSNLNLECSLIVHCKRLADRSNYCKRDRGCYCEVLFEGLRKSDPMDVRQVLEEHPDVPLVRKSELDSAVVLGVAILFVLLVSFCFFKFFKEGFCPGQILVMKLRK